MRQFGSAVGWTLVLIGALFMLASSIWVVAVHPEWTSSQNIRAMWPFYLGGFIIVLIGNWTIGSVRKRTTALSKLDPNEYKWVHTNGNEYVLERTKP